METAANKASSDNKREVNFGRLFLGLFLVTAGFLLLARMAGILRFQVNVWQFWPVLLIYWGLSLFKGRNFFGGLLGLVLTLLALALVVYLVLGRLQLNRPEPGQQLYKEALISCFS
jgi:hypothetical protein